MHRRVNGIGKSNMFDVVEFLSYQTIETLVEASQRVRGASGVRGGDPRDLFGDGFLLGRQNATN